MQKNVPPYNMRTGTWYIRGLAIETCLRNSCLESILGCDQEIRYFVWRSSVPCYALLRQDGTECGKCGPWLDANSMQWGPWADSRTNGG